MEKINIFTESIWQRNFFSGIDVITYIHELTVEMFQEFEQAMTNKDTLKSIIADIVMASDGRLNVDETIGLIRLGLDTRRGVRQIATRGIEFKELSFSVN